MEFYLYVGYITQFDLSEFNLNHEFESRDEHFTSKYRTMISLKIAM